MRESDHHPAISRLMSVNRLIAPPKPNGCDGPGADEIGKTFTRHLFANTDEQAGRALFENCLP